PEGSGPRRKSSNWSAGWAAGRPWIWRAAPSPSTRAWTASASTRADRSRVAPVSARTTPAPFFPARRARGTGMRRLLEIARTGLDALLLHPLRSLVTTTALVAALTPFLTGLGLARGIRDNAEASVRFGADLYVTGSQFGRSVPVPLSAIGEVRGLDGAPDVAPRIVGEVVLGKNQEPAVLVGLPAEHFPTAARCVAGRLPADGGRNEFVVGSELARRLRL